MSFWTHTFKRVLRPSWFFARIFTANFCFACISKISLWKPLMRNSKFLKILAIESIASLNFGLTFKMDRFRSSWKYSKKMGRSASIKTSSRILTRESLNLKGEKFSLSFVKIMNIKFIRWKVVLQYRSFKKQQWAMGRKILSLLSFGRKNLGLPMAIWC